MREKVFAAIFRRDEAVTLRVVEPLDRACCHRPASLQERGDWCLGSKYYLRQAQRCSVRRQTGTAKTRKPNASFIRALRRRSQVPGPKCAFLLKNLLQSSNIRGSDGGFPARHDDSASGRERSRGRKNNDDYTPMDFVVVVLQTVFAMSREKATQVMLQVHREGMGVCGTYTREVAAAKVDQVLNIARKHQHPLQCTMEET
ncbi:MAG: ATP-dependent Clp protease adapter ClpS [Betaproteobacteria bacterium]|nr:MAG: ATP-dependent Clp protease adapter ClpS [Betaproteobacteria bacterium]